MKNNPFSVIFGKYPLLAIERPIEKNEIIDTFSSCIINQQIYLITSIRGSGKTVLLTEIAQYFKNKEDWVVIELNTETDMLLSFLSKLNSKVGSLIKSLNFNLTLFNIMTIGANLENKVTDPETAIIKILESLKKQNKRILVTIDEAINNKNMKIFASTFQILVREDLPIFLLMTGLFNNIRNLQDEKNLTFLYRAPRINLGPLNLKSIENKYKENFNINDETAYKMAILTKGYAFAFQALGYLTYKHDGNYLEALDEYRTYLEEYSYNKIWSELSINDKEILYAMTKTNSKKIADILKELNFDSNSFNQYRIRLINNGVLVSKTRGTLEFALPLFKEFTKDNYLYDQY